MNKLIEAATIKARARAAVKALHELLTDKTLSDTLRKQMENLSAAMSKTWSDLEGEADLDPVREAAAFGNWLESRIHLSFTEMADGLYGEGQMTREERIALSGAISAALAAFTAHVQETVPHFYDLDEPAKLERCVRHIVQQQGIPEDSAWAMCRSQIGESACDTDLGNETMIPLLERALGSDGVISMKIIQPGWGSTGYYTPEVLGRDGPQAFPRGTKMFWNHQTPAEESARPEGDLRDLAAELVSDARWVPEHPKGPGLYADAKVFEAYKSAVEDLAPHIGVSIRAKGRFQPGSADGRVGPIITSIARAKSVDFVTSPGAGGEIIQLFESRRLSANNPIEGDEMDEKELKALQESNTTLSEANKVLEAQVARLLEAQILREAGDLVSTELAAVQLPGIVKTRLQSALVANLPMKDGALDKDAMKANVISAIEAEKQYLSSIMGVKIVGMGDSPAVTPKLEDMEKSLSEAFLSMGLDDSAAKIAAKGR